MVPIEKLCFLLEKLYSEGMFLISMCKYDSNELLCGIRYKLTSYRKALLFHKLVSSQLCLISTRN